MKMWPLMEKGVPLKRASHVYCIIKKNRKYLLYYIKKRKKDLTRYYTHFKLHVKNTLNFFSPPNSNFERTFSILIIYFEIVNRKNYAILAQSNPVVRKQYVMPKSHISYSLRGDSFNHHFPNRAISAAC